MQPRACTQKNETSEAAYDSRTSCCLEVGKLSLVTMWCCGLDCIPPRRCTGVLTPRSSECDLIWRQAKVSQNEVIWVCPILTDVFIEREKLDAAT